MKEMFEKSFFTGINYWGSKEAINMWENFDPESIEGDLKLLSEIGITHLRVFPLWPVFQPLYGIYGANNVYEYTFKDGKELPDTEAGRAGVSEDACQKFEKFLSLCDKYNMKLIVAVITGHMSFRTYNPPAFDGKMLLTNPTVIKWQLRFTKYFVSRFKNSSAIVAWDLGNEVENMPSDATNPDAFYVWCDTIGNAIRLADGTRPVISGLQHTQYGDYKVNFRMIEDITTDDNGAATFAKYEANGTNYDYYLVETQAPSGYNILDNAVKVNFTYEEVEETDGTYTVKVPNKSGIQLPNTGGTGTVIFTVIGIALMVGAVVLFVVSRKKNKS